MYISSPDASKDLEKLLKLLGEECANMDRMRERAQEKEKLKQPRYIYVYTQGKQWKEKKHKKIKLKFFFIFLPSLHNSTLHPLDDERTSLLPQ